MPDSNQIRINELARELEIKAKVLIDYLPEIGVTEKKTHSSSLDNSHAELVRKHFGELAAKEAAAEADKQAKATAAKARPAARPAAPASVTVAAKPATAEPSAPAAAPEKPVAPPAAPAGIPARPTLVPPRPAAPGVPPTAARPSRVAGCRCARRSCETRNCFGCGNSSSYSYETPNSCAARSFGRDSRPAWRGNREAPRCSSSGASSWCADDQRAVRQWAKDIPRAPVLLQALARVVPAHPRDSVPLPRPAHIVREVRHGRVPEDLRRDSRSARVVVARRMSPWAGRGRVPAFQRPNRASRFMLASLLRPLADVR